MTAFKINPDIIQKYLLTITDKIRDATDPFDTTKKIYAKNFNYDSNIVTPSPQTKIRNINVLDEDVINDVQREQYLMKEVDGFIKNELIDSENQIYFNCSEELNSAEKENPHKRFLSNLSIYLFIVKKDNITGISQYNEIRIDQINSSLGAAQVYFSSEDRPFKIQKISIENLSKDIFTTKLAVNGSINLQFKNFTSITKKIKSLNYEPNTFNINNDFDYSLLNLISYLYDNEIKYGLKFVLKNDDKIVKQKSFFITPIKHNFTFFIDNKGETHTFSDKFFHDVTINFVAAEESTQEKLKNKNLYHKFQIEDTATDLGGLQTIVAYCQTLESAVSTAISPAALTAVIPTINAAATNVLNYIGNSANNKDIQTSLKVLSEKIDLYLLKSIFKSMPLYQIEEELDKFNYIISFASFFDKFTATDNLINAGLVTAQGFLISGTVASLLGVTYTGLSIASGGLLVLGTLLVGAAYAAYTAYSNTKVVGGPNTTGNSVNTNAITLNIRKNANIDFDVVDTAITAVVGKKNKGIEAIRSALNAYQQNTDYEAVNENSVSTEKKKIAFFFLGDLISILYSLVNNQYIENNEIIIGNMKMLKFTSSSGAISGTRTSNSFILNIGHIPISVTYFLDFLEKKLSSSSYELDIDRFLIEFLEHLKKPFNDYTRLAERVYPDPSATTQILEFSPFINSVEHNNVNDTSAKNISLILNNLDTKFGNFDTTIKLYADPTTNPSINIGTVIQFYKEEIKKFTQETGTIHFSTGRITYIGNSIKFRNIDITVLPGPVITDYSNNDYCNDVIAEYQIPCITVSDNSNKYGQIVKNTRENVKFSRLEDTQLVSAAIATGQNVLTSIYTTNISVFPHMFMFIGNFNYMAIASPIATEKQFQFSGLYLITSAKLEIDFSDSISYTNEGRISKWKYDLEMKHIWYGSVNAVGGVVAPTLPDGAKKATALCADFNKFYIDRSGKLKLKR